MSSKKVIYLSYLQRSQIANTQEFKRTNYIWNKLHCNSIRNNGYVMDLITAMKPVSRYDWEVRYFKWRKQYFGNEQYPFEQVITKFASAANISINKAFIYHYIRVIDKTYDGYHDEQEAMKNIWLYISKRHPLDANEYRIIHAPKEMDRSMRIDVEIFHHECKSWKEVAGIQLKPKTYFTRSHAKWAKEAFKENYSGQLMYVQKIGAPVYYWTYEDLRNGKKPMLYLDTRCKCHQKIYA